LKKPGWIFYFLFTALLVSGNPESDSLKFLLEQADKPEKIDLLLALATSYSLYNFDSTIIYGTQAIQLADELNRPVDKAKTLKLIGNTYFRKGNFDLALNNYQKALSVFEAHGELIQAGNIYNNMGLLYQKWGKNLDALTVLNKSLKIYEDAGNEALKTGPLVNIGLIHFQTGNYSKASEYYNQAYSIAEKYQNLFSLGNITNNLGALYKAWGKYTNALGFYNESLKFRIQRNDLTGEAVNYHNIGEVYADLGEYTEAIKYILKSISLKKEIGSNSTLCISLNKLGDIYSAWEKYELAIGYYIDALELEKNMNDKLNLANSLYGLGQVFYKTDVFRKALDNYKEAAMIYEEIDSKKEIADTYSEMGNIYSDKLADYKKANEYFDMAEKIYNELNNKTGLAQLCYYQGRRALAVQDPRQALVYFNKSKAYLPLNNYLMLENYLSMAECYQLLNDLPNAIQTLKTSLIYKDSVSNDKNNYQNLQYEAQFNLKQQEREIDLLKTERNQKIQELEKKRHTLILFSALISLVFLAALFILYINLRLKRLNIRLKHQQGEIEEQKEELETANVQLLEAKNQAEKISGFKSDFLANISHEIRTPLNAISGYSKLLFNQTENPKNKHYLQNIIHASENMLIIINDLLDFSKIEAGKMMIEQTGFNAMSIVSQVLSSLKLKAEEKNISIEIHFAPEIPDQLTGDPYRLSQILTNLINNAIKFSWNGQVISIEANCITKEYTCLMIFKVSDHGIGIPEDKLESIFESFTQANSNTARNFGGAGLGLSIVKRLVELQNGTIRVNSKVNEGSVFTVEIEYPIGKVHKPMVLNNTKSMDKTDNHLKTIILLVEDNEINQEIARDTILSWGDNYEVDIAVNGQEAINALENKVYHLVLMDIQMPVMDGNAATLFIRNKLPEPICDIPIIGMTAHGFSQEKETALNNGMNDYIVKPFNPDELRVKIDSFSV